MKNEWKYYKLTKNTKTAMKFLPTVLKESFLEYNLSVYNSYKNQWIDSSDPNFDIEFGIETDEVIIFLKGTEFSKVSFKLQKGDTTVAYIKIAMTWGLLDLDVLHIKSETFDSLTEKIVSRLTLEEATEEELKIAFSSLPSINEKVLEIDSKLNNLFPLKKEVKRVFLSLRFDDHSKAIAFELEKFFNLLEIEMITGLGVEPRSISEKVVDRFNLQIDLFVILVTKTGTSNWINQEIGLAKEKKISSLIIKSGENTDFQSGLLNDNEYIVYNNISEAFIGILEAIKYLKNTK
ncbi:hypothetical protein B1J93_01310 [Leptospira kirschneri serovar Pomona]|uniref:TIR domain-containing protein n=1 Tax=Leptospira kirschneri serovar Pomona TaxID=561005 RepID=A0A1T1E2T5_9LEPT|nr:hypothetical protein [Leptospira kirschneri]OOV47370.1 hypothetical protein B1J93_01310 [Leptospira kirschneri serovar Pomona]